MCRTSFIEAYSQMIELIFTHDGNTNNGGKPTRSLQVFTIGNIEALLRRRASPHTYTSLLTAIRISKFLAIDSTKRRNTGPDVPFYRGTVDPTT